jgi:hypothetical protein
MNVHNPFVRSSEFAIGQSVRRRVELNRAKTKMVDTLKGEAFGFLGFDLRRVHKRKKDGRFPPNHYGDCRWNRACGSHGDRPRQGAAVFVGRAGAQHRAITITLFRGRQFFMPAIARHAGSANRSPSHIEPVSGVPKRKLENGGQRLAPQSRQSSPEIPEFAGQRLQRASLTREDVGGSHTPGYCMIETALTGWAWRIRTSKCHFERRLLESCCATNQELLTTGRNSRQSHIFSR